MNVLIDWAADPPASHRCVAADTGNLCTQGDQLLVVFDTCSSSANQVPVSDCAGSEIGGEWVLSTRYRETGQLAAGLPGPVRSVPGAASRDAGETRGRRRGGRREPPGLRRAAIAA